MESLDGFEGQNNSLTPLEFQLIQGAGQLAGEWAAARTQSSGDKQPERTNKPLFALLAIGAVIGLSRTRDPRASTALGIIAAAAAVGFAS